MQQFLTGNSKEWYLIKTFKVLDEFSVILGI